MIRNRLGSYMHLLHQEEVGTRALNLIDQAGNPSYVIPGPVSSIVTYCFDASSPAGPKRYIFSWSGDIYGEWSWNYFQLQWYTGSRRWRKEVSMNYDGTSGLHSLVHEIKCTKGRGTQLFLPEYADVFEYMEDIASRQPVVR